MNCNGMNDSRALQQQANKGSRALQIEWTTGSGMRKHLHGGESGGDDAEGDGRDR